MGWISNKLVKLVQDIDADDKGIAAVQTVVADFKQALMGGCPTEGVLHCDSVCASQSCTMPPHTALLQPYPQAGCHNLALQPEQVSGFPLCKDLSYPIIPACHTL